MRLFILFIFFWSCAIHGQDKIAVELQSKLMFKADQKLTEYRRVEVDDGTPHRD